MRNAFWSVRPFMRHNRPFAAKLQSDVFLRLVCFLIGSTLANVSSPPHRGYQASVRTDSVDFTTHELNVMRTYARRDYRFSVLFKLRQTSHHSQASFWIANQLSHQLHLYRHAHRTLLSYKLEANDTLSLCDCFPNRNDIYATYWFAISDILLYV